MFRACLSRELLDGDRIGPCYDRFRMERVNFKLIGVAVVLGLTSLISFFMAIGDWYHDSAWRFTIAHIEEVIPLCKHNGRSSYLSSDCPDPRNDMQPSGSRGTLTFVIADGRLQIYKFFDENHEAISLSAGMDVGIKYNPTDPSEFELANALQRRVPTMFWFAIFLFMACVLVTRGLFRIAHDRS